MALNSEPKGLVTVANAIRRGAENQMIVVTGPAGSGRSTAINALEDIRFEAIDNLPISLLKRLFVGEPIYRPIVAGIDTRTRDFGVDRLFEALGDIETATDTSPVVVYLDCDAATLVRRYSETRRRHPLSPNETALVGIEREQQLLASLRDRAEVLIDTSTMTPHDLRAEMVRLFGEEGGSGSRLAVSLQSFSYKRGAPRGTDMMIDVRFLRNPHWQEGLRSRDGRDPDVAEYVRSDPSFAPFLTRLSDLLGFLLPAYKAEGKSYFSLALGCTGGRHRSVMLVETLAKELAADGWQVSIRHRDLDRASSGSAQVKGVVTQ